MAEELVKGSKQHSPIQMLFPNLESLTCLIKVSGFPTKRGLLRGVKAIVHSRAQRTLECTL